MHKHSDMHRHPQVYGVERDGANLYLPSPKQNNCYRRKKKKKTTETEKEYSLGLFAIGEMREITRNNSN